MTRLQRSAAVLVVLGLCACLGVVGLGVVGASDHLTDTDTQHEHPDDVSDEGDLAAVQSYLADRMTEIHLDCAENLSAGETVACDRLDEEYPDYLEQYASVERERTGETETAETFRQVRENQTELAEERVAFEETYEEYQAARAAGDQERSRRLARELAERADRIEELGGALNVQFRTLGTQTGRDYDGARRATNETTMAVIRTSTQVERTEFTPSELTATADDPTASFRDPVAISGRLTADNGTALADRNLSVTVNNRTVATTETDAFGRYEAIYRPVTTTTGPTNVTVRYEPTGADPYLGSNGAAAVDVEAVAASLFVDVVDDRVAFGENVTVDARVVVVTEDAPDVPVAMFLGDERIATGRTGENGSVELAGPVPATVDDGERTLSVRASKNGTALEPTVENRTVTVAETDSTLTVEGLLDGEDLVLSGRLTAAGRPVAGQRVGVNVDGEVREVAVTDADGRYEVRVPRETGGRGVWSVTADYNNPESNLGPTTRTRQLTADDLEATNGTDTSTGLAGQLRQLVVWSPFLRTLSDEALLGLTGGVVALAGLGLAAVVFLRRREPEPEPSAEGVTPAVTDVSEADTGAGPSDDGAPTDPAPDTLAGVEALDVARARLGDGDPGAAVKIGYGAVRRQLAASGGEDVRTHWEFYRDVEPDLSEDRADALERLTVAYQRAEFAPEGVGSGTARAALNAAETCLSPATDGRPTDVA